MDAAAYGRALKKLLPPGPVWRLVTESVLLRLFHGTGDELARVEQRGRDWIEETDPRTATETLSDWERMLGLPDEDVTAIPGTDAERRTAIVQKLLRTGGQSPAYFEGLALACGWVVYVTEPYAATVARCGTARCGDPMNGTGFAFVWQVDVDTAAAGALSSDELERVLTRVKPAHTLIVFNYL